MIHLTEVASWPETNVPVVESVEWEFHPLACPPNIEHRHGQFVHLHGDVVNRVIASLLGWTVEQPE